MYSWISVNFQNVFKALYTILSLLVCVFMCIQVYHVVYIEVREQLEGTIFLFPLSGLQGLNTGSQILWQVPWPAVILSVLFIWIWFPPLWGPFYFWLYNSPIWFFSVCLLSTIFPCLFTLFSFWRTWLFCPTPNTVSQNKA